MTAGTRENLAYKTSDHLFRSKDEYAQGKYDATMRWLRDRIQPGQTLLNVGCGGGEFTAMAHAAGLEVIACEPEPEAYALAARAAPVGTDVRQCGLMELVGTVPPADYLVMHDVLEHIEDDVAAVNAIRSVLKPGATAILSVPAYQWLFGRHDVELGHFRRYTRRSLLALFRDGFAIERARYYGASFIPVTLYFSRLAQKPYPAASVSDGLGHSLMRLVCQLESRIPSPIGTSVMIRMRRL